MHKCWRCGKELEKIEYDTISAIQFDNMKDENYFKLQEKLDMQKIEGMSYSRPYCNECKMLQVAETKKMFDDYTDLKYKVMFERALQSIEKSKTIFMEEIKEDVDFIYDLTMTYKKFDSKEEIIVAIMLLSEGYDFKIQYKVKNYNLDFYIPELNVVLEVDGYMHEHKGLEDAKRDREIREILGDKFEVIRIPTDYISENPSAIVTGIIEMYKEKKRLRDTYDGLLPENFSKRDKMYYEKFFMKNKIS